MAFATNLSGDRFSFFIFLFCVLSILACASLILVSWGKLPPQIPLFYSRPWGETMLAPPLYIWILPAIATLSVIVNFITGNLVAAQNKQGFSTNKQSFSTNKNLSFAQNLDSRSARIKQSFSTNKQSFSTNRFLTRILTIFSLLVSLTILYTEVKIISLLI